MIQLKDAQSLPQITLRDAASQSGSVPVGDGKVLFSVPSEKFWAPSLLFASGEAGAWYDPSDSATLFQDAAGTTPAGVGDPVGLMLDKSGNGNNASQSTSNARPTLQEDGSGNWYLSFDGIDDFMTAPITSIAQPLSLCVAARPAANTNYATLLDSANASNRCALRRYASSSAPNLYAGVQLTGAVGDWDFNTDFIYSLAVNGSASSIRANGSLSASGDAGTQSLADGITLGARYDGAASNGAVRVYGVLVLDRLLTSLEASKAEHYLARNTGVTL